MARDWAGASDEHGDVTILGPDGGEAAQHLLSLPMAEQKSWMNRYIAAAGGCDVRLFDELVGELR